MKNEKEKLLITGSKFEYIARHVYNNKLAEENEKEFIERVYSALSETSFDERISKLEYVFLLLYVTKYGFSTKILDEVFLAAETKNNNTSLVNKPQYLHDFFYVCANTQGFTSEQMEKLSVLQSKGIIPEVKLLDSYEQKEFIRGCNKIVRHRVSFMGIWFFE